MTLTGKDKRKLKSLGMTMADDIQLGKGGLTAGHRAAIEKLFTLRELVKIRFGELEGSARGDFAQEIAQEIQAQCVSVVGRTMLLYRENPALAYKDRALKVTDSKPANPQEHPDDED